MFKMANDMPRAVHSWIMTLALMRRYEKHVLAIEHRSQAGQLLSLAVESSRKVGKI